MQIKITQNKNYIYKKISSFNFHLKIVSEQTTFKNHQTITNFALTITSVVWIAKEVKGQPIEQWGHQRSTNRTNTEQ